MGITDTGKSIPSSGATDAGCAAQVKNILFRQMRQSRKAMRRINQCFATAPGGSQGVIDALSPSEYAELNEMMTPITTLSNDHKLTDQTNITVTVPTQS